MTYNIVELNTINIWNIYEKVRDHNAAIKFCQRYRLLRQTPNCAIHGTAYVLEKRNNTYKWVCYRKGHQRRPKVCLREGSFVQGSHLSISAFYLPQYILWIPTLRRVQTT